MTPARTLVAVVLALAAVLSSWAVLRLQREAEPPPLVGPPRSDYTATDFELVMLDADGGESFVVTGPLLTRHPAVGTLSVDEPRFAVPDQHGKPWTARAADAWISADGSELRLTGDVQIDGPPGDAAALGLRGESLSIFPRENRAASDDVVTVLDGATILTGRGIRAQFDTRRVEFLSEVRIHHVPRRS